MQVDGELQSWLLNTPVRFAGHAHWQNIKKVKTLKDDEKQKLHRQTIQQIHRAVRGRCCICYVSLKSCLLITYN